MTRLDPRSPYLSAAPDPVRDIVFAGAFTGIVGGIAMAMLAMLASGAAGQGFFLPARLVAAMLHGTQALVLTEAIFDGIVLHLLVSAAWGVLFAAFLTEPATPFAAFFAGLFYGIGIWVVTTFALLPVVNPLMRERALSDGGLFLVAHLIFGASMVLLLPIRSRLAGREPRVRS